MALSYPGGAEIVRTSRTPLAAGLLLLFKKIIIIDIIINIIINILTINNNNNITIIIIIQSLHCCEDVLHCEWRSFTNYARRKVCESGCLTGWAAAAAAVEKLGT